MNDKICKAIISITITLCIVLTGFRATAFPVFAGNVDEFSSGVHGDSEIDAEPEFGQFLGMVDGLKYSYVSNRCVTISGYGWTSLPTDVVIPDTVVIDNVSYTVTDIEQGVFSEHTGLKSVALGNNIQVIGGYAFYGCTGLKSISFGANLQFIGYAAFSNCLNLEKITIPSSVSTIMESAFGGCPDFDLASGNTAYKMEDGLLLTQDGKLLLGCPANRTGSVTVPDTVVRIGDGAFIKSQITEIKIPSSVKEIGGWAFSSCNKLNTVAIPATVSSVEMEAFVHCESLGSAVLSAENVGEGVFVGCDILREVVFHRSVKSIGYRAFSYCPELKKLTFKGYAPPEIAGPKYNSLGHVFEESPLESIMVPNGRKDDYRAALLDKIPNANIITETVTNPVNP